MSKDLERIFLNALEDSKERLFRICSIYSNDADDAKDLFQEVLVNIWKSLSDFRGDSSIATWMYRVTLNVSLRHRANIIRHRNRHTPFDPNTIEITDGQSDNIPNLEKLQVLRQCVRRLNDADKAIMALYLENLPYKEIATITGLKENTVAVRVKRIKVKLLHCINEKL